MADKGLSRPSALYPFSPSLLMILPSLSTIVLHVVASRHFSFAGLVVLIYDHFLTFGDEVELVWAQPLSAVSIIFLVNRYLTPAVLAVDLYDKGGLTPDVGKHFCRIWVVLEGYLNLLILASIHAMMLMRVQALWGNRKPFYWALTLAFWLYFLSSFGILTVGLLEVARTIHFEKMLIHACWTMIPGYLWTVWIPALVLESLIFVLTALRAYQFSVDGVDLPIVQILWRDGFQYYVGIMIFTLFPLLVWCFAPPTLVALPKYGSMALIDILGFRIILNLRRYCSDTRTNSLTPFQDHELQNRSYHRVGRSQMVSGASSESDRRTEFLRRTDSRV